MSRKDRDATLFDSIAGQYAKKDIARSSSIARKAQLLYAVGPVLKKRKTLGTIVDIGCGAGASASYLSGCFERYIGIDHSEKMIDAARALNKNVPGAEFVVSDAISAAIPANTADLILSIGALHHIEDLDTALGSIKKIAKPGAFFVAVEPQNSNPIIQSLRRIRQAVDKGYSREQVFFSEKRLKTLLAAHGITDLNAEYYGFLSPPLAQVILNPQAIFARVSLAAVRFDAWCAGHLPVFMGRFTFNIIMRGIFSK